MNYIRGTIGVLMTSIMAMGILYGQAVDASFTAKTMVSDKYSYDKEDMEWKSFEIGDKKNPIKVTLDTLYNDPAIQITEGDSAVFKKVLPPFKPEGLWAYELQESTSKRNFYIIGVRESYTEPTLYGGKVWKTKINEYIVGKQPTTGKWKVYANLDDYYFPRHENPGFSMMQEEITVRSSNYPDMYAYKLHWNEETDSFNYTDLGEISVPYFTSALAYDSKYRPVYAHMDTEVYLDMTSITTLYEDSDTWIFTAKSLLTHRGNELLMEGKGSSKYQVNRSTKQAWYWDERNGKWKYLDSHHMAGYMLPAYITANWAVKVRYGYFLNADDPIVQDYAKYYKGK